MAGLPKLRNQAGPVVVDGQPLLQEVRLPLGGPEAFCVEQSLQDFGASCVAEVEQLVGTYTNGRIRTLIPWRNCERAQYSSSSSRCAAGAAAARGQPGLRPWADCAYSDKAVKVHRDQGFDPRLLTLQPGADVKPECLDKDRVKGTSALLHIMPVRSSAGSGE